MWVRWAIRLLGTGWTRSWPRDGRSRAVQEAGASGYWLHRLLVALGVKNLVVAPKAMGQGGKRQKTDRRDSAELVDGLDRYLRGQDEALSVVGVPSVEGEENEL